ncbi:mRNA degradation ribonuclease J1/J2 (metallo-beta-lactamase superfamily) [Aliarcobacter butzleri 7h1h]|uniref:ribonuclease J n=1 Tax=Aliarcobacter butzleri TaxID=28197 RepID=UPI0001F15B26|nr:ribonuclease J [Aliarcobacter butzleri]AGR76390.1 mRNA degradation ribonuclease J1/J2 (metallo-beta-lactamase superfamily) [Aliarcobacter butzleri 7h1h]EFU70881.1 metallo-beta-lactamase [Aliarcobacter butzleri JV22]MCT7627921.1 ribonuclease J [Aliarcobacter butzleri]MCT7638683.1 ribonuclease J [Aliarcobacter butzleri]MDN5049423.1 ribonuclease J [Aliarcobacter butzleri]
MEEINKEEFTVVIKNENSSNGEEETTKKPPFKKRKPKPKVPRDNSTNSNNNQKSGEGWVTDLKKAYLINEKIHKDRLNPHYKLNLNTSAKLKITPLGGLNEIGGNMMVVETENEAIIVDVGMSFPDGEMHGVDILIPDFTYIREIKDKVVAVIITHGHEDHIGAMPYLFKEMQFPIYGTSLPLEMIGSKFDEHKMREHRGYFRAISKRTPIKIGNDFEVEWMHITHSIIDSSAVAIKTEAGTMIHTGDFKIDHTPIDGFPTDLHRLAHYGEEGVLVLTSDSTNSHSPGFTRTEKTVGPTFDKIFSSAKGRVVMSTFSSNIHRVAQAIEKALIYGRKICVIGRSMEKNLEIAMNLGYIKFPKDQFIEAHEVNKYNDKEVLIVTTGSQGESMSALYRMAIHEHRHIKIKPEDQIILSSKAIPGNEASVSEIINHLLKAGAKVAYQDFPDIHVSGHAGQEEQKLMLRLVKPKFFLPVHGEYNHALKHGQTGVDCGVLERNVYIMSDGEQIEVTPKYLKKVKTVKSGKVYIDNQLNHRISDDVVLDRQTMAKEGIVMIVAQINENDRTLAQKPKVSSFGLVSDKQDKYFVKEIEDILGVFLENVKPGILKNNRILEDELRKVVRKHCTRKYKKYPMIVPTIFVQ